MSDWPVVDVRPDPRISNLRPAWLVDNAWRDRLDALTTDDVRWIEDQWELAGGAGPVDPNAKIYYLPGGYW